MGQKSYHPKLLLRLLFYGYAIGIRSGRKIAAACESDVAFMYLSSMYKPDFRTINDFRKDQVEEIMKKAEAMDKEEDEKYGDNRGDELPKEINTKEKLRNKIKEVIKQIKEEDDKINLIDNDAKVVRSSRSLRTSYNCQTSSTANGIIVSAYVTNAASDREHSFPAMSPKEP